MFLTEPARTQFDLNFRIFGVYVRVHPMFWLVSGLLGFNLLDAAKGGGLQPFLLWIVCVFVSILIHEMGHVLVGRLFGTDGHIVLYSFGGLAVGSNALASRWKRIAVCFAGPAAQLVFYAMLWFGVPYLLRGRHLAEIPKGVRWAYEFLLEINLGWALLNLLPIWPLDGGQISRDFLGWLMPDRGLSASLGLSFLIAAVLAINAAAAHYGHVLIRWLPARDLYLAFLFGMLALGSFQALQQVNASPKRPIEEEFEAWERDADYWKR